MAIPELSLKNLVSLENWQKIQDNFSKVIGISIRSLDEQGDTFTKCSGQLDLCKNILKGKPAKEFFCASCLPTFLGGRAIADKNLKFVCELGLYNFITPVKLNDQQVMGYIIVGPVILVMRKLKEEYAELAKTLDVSLDELWSALLQVRIMSFQGMQSTIELIKDIAEYTINLAYKTILMKERRLPFGLEPERISRIMHDLLEVAFEVSQADLGSIMLVDKYNKNELTISASKGIPEEIASKVRVKLGEGISGKALKDNTSFLIDDNNMDNRIRPYLKRPYIKTSMVLPIKVKDHPVGVINLGALKSSKIIFNADSIQLMNKLVGLATTTIHE